MVYMLRLLPQEFSHEAIPLCPLSLDCDLCCTFIQDTKKIASIKHLPMLLSTLTKQGGDTLEQVAQRGCGCPIPGGIQGQAGCGSGQPGLLIGDPAHSRGLKLDDHCRPFQLRPFYDSVTYTQLGRKQNFI